ncbi:MAG: Crp/Fnr family transcriptional regulator [Lentihominibacter sp.]|jgi:CRP-like cAMP-binding protein
MYRAEIFAASGMLDEIRESEQAEVLQNLKISSLKYRKGEMIFCTGDLMDKVCIVASGSVRSEKNYPNGEVHIIEVYDESQIFGLEVSVSRTQLSFLDYICNEDADVYFVSMRSIEKSAYAGPISRALMHHLADDNIRTSHKLEILAENGLRARIMIYLRILQQKADGNTVTVRMSREQLAQFLCVNRSALSNELNKMKREGVIDFSREKFTLLK